MDEYSVLVSEFAECVAAQSKAVLLGNAEGGNSYARRYIEAFRTLRSMGNGGRDALATLLSDGRADVRVMAASFLLRHSGEKARRILEAEAKGRGLTAVSAAQAL